MTQHGEQILVSLLKQPRATYSEDCLTLNVWTTAKRSDKKAVLLWIHGGGYNTGTTDNAAYSGKYLAQKENVVVVTVK